MQKQLTSQINLQNQKQKKVTQAQILDTHTLIYIIEKKHLTQTNLIQQDIIDLFKNQIIQDSSLHQIIGGKLCLIFQLILQIQEIYSVKQK